jgi:hypothetical protein
MTLPVMILLNLVIVVVLGVIARFAPRGA